MSPHRLSRESNEQAELPGAPGGAGNANCTRALQARVDRMPRPNAPCVMSGSALPLPLVARDGRSAWLRAAEIADAEGLAAFLHGLSAATRAVFLPHAADEATVHRYLSRATAGVDLAYVLATDAGLAGYAFLWDFDQPVPLLGIGFADAWQGQGLGEKVLRRLLDDARHARRAAVELSTVPGNTRALRLYERVGFVRLGDVDNVAGDGRVVREHRMFLPLQPDARPPERHFGPPV